MSLSRKTALGGLFIALSVLLPQVIHLIGAADLGRMLLPMHIPVLLSGFVLGPVFGLTVGAISPILSCLLTNMPPVSRLAFMVIELAGYGFMSGLLFRTLKLYKTRYGTALSLAGAMIFGRLLYALSLFVASDLLGISQIGPIAAREAVTAGLIGIVIQIILVPTIIYLLRKIRVIDPADTQKKRNQTAG
ncbi:MAG: ECF transporter S component [Clostridiales bacterium]|jgi:niacin transporter|nr:ECF transporter S component [Clostridiales bacterium]HOA33150.1 ECF transporter S component [Clostridiales bacterium]HOJ34942.1 ECF transporter S component [Clostridiales bacterium]HOL78425.1 ECF transporter S component [Clostridiales bacterium]HPP68398.1 ECF transporter S component [Clostridiales bacterium]